MNEIIIKDNEKFTISHLSVEESDEYINHIDKIASERIWFIWKWENTSTPCKKEIIKSIINDKHSTIIILKKDGKIIGDVTLISHDNPEIKHWVELGISIDKEWRKKGLGDALMKFAIEFCKKKKFRKISLSVFSSNQAAITLYKKYGFINEGVRKEQYYINGKFIDEVLMSKFLY